MLYTILLSIAQHHLLLLLPESYSANCPTSGKNSTSSITWHIVIFISNLAPKYVPKLSDCFPRPHTEPTALAP